MHSVEQQYFLVVSLKNKVKHGLHLVPLQLFQPFLFLGVVLFLD